jgi:transposase
MSGKRDLTDAQWAILQPLLPPRNRTGRPRADDRRTLNAILYVLRTGCAWRGRPLGSMPDKYGDDATAHRRLQPLHKRGIRPCIPPKRRPKNWKPHQVRPVKQYTEEYRHRWPVEPCALWAAFAWLGHQRRLLVRHEHKSETFHAFCTLACPRIALIAVLR